MRFQLTRIKGQQSDAKRDVADHVLWKMLISAFCWKGMRTGAGGVWESQKILRDMFLGETMYNRCNLVFSDILVHDYLPDHPVRQLIREAYVQYLDTATLGNLSRLAKALFPAANLENSVSSSVILSTFTRPISWSFFTTW